VLPLALLPAPCVLRQHALESVKRLKRPWKIAFTGSSIVSVQAAVCAGLGVSILPRSSLLPGMQVLPRGKYFPEPGRLDVGVLRGAGARADIVAALERVIRQTLDVLALTRSF
jgi:DNA-binding transcriptional LysR family regulator